MYKAYEEAVLSLAKYPHADEKTLESTLYPVFGLVGESTESLEKFGAEASGEELVKELGDVLWYVTRVSAESGSSLTEIIGRAKPTKMQDSETPESTLFINMVASSGRCAEHLKKALRDDHDEYDVPLNETRAEKVHAELVTVVENLSSIALRHDSSISEIAEKNVAKLQDRDKRGMIHGDGDNR